MTADMAIPEGVRELADTSLQGRNTLRVPARAARLFEVDDAGQLPALLAALDDMPVMILGSGSNMLFVDDYPGAVIALTSRGVLVETDEHTHRVVVAAGELWDDFVRWSLAQGLAGLENLILIPGTVGAAPIQNIGAYGCEVGEYIESVEAWDRQTASVISLDQAACRFAYRDSIFKQQPGRYIVTAVRFALPRQAAPRLGYAGIPEELERMGVARPAPVHIAEAVERLRRRKLPDPAVLANAGSFFKNPIVSTEFGAIVQQQHPGLVSWQAGRDRHKLSAAWLIEAAGLKGYRDGDAGISSRHALILVNHGQASGRQLWAVAEHVMNTVEARFGLRLEPEPIIIGPTDA
ncbi:UDP-N-acetylmuramate dehydrogenase [Frateuria aurantia]